MCRETVRLARPLMLASLCSLVVLLAQAAYGTVQGAARAQASVAGVRCVQIDNCHLSFIALLITRRTSVATSD